MANFDKIEIINPKMRRVQSGWEEFFPYYAGYSDSFARSLMASVGLSQKSTVLDPWNGSGTTTSMAAEIGLRSVGLDINPVMVIVARSRALPPSEADSLFPLASAIIKSAQRNKTRFSSEDPLFLWFCEETTQSLRNIEVSIRKKLLGELTLTSGGPKLENMSSLAATYYVVLFNLAKNLVKAFQSSNPTWLRKPRVGEDKISIKKSYIHAQFFEKVSNMSDALAAKDSLFVQDPFLVSTRLADSTKSFGLENSIDFVLTSPPYCTRIDYTAATRIQLAILSPVLDTSVDELSRSMIGSVKVPKQHVMPLSEWGGTCLNFLDRLKNHPSKASNGYYLKGHADYFDKMYKSIGNISESLRLGGGAVFVVQDSFYKELHNDVPKIIMEMAERRNLTLQRKEDFEVAKSISIINARARLNHKKSKTIESVLCFKKTSIG